MIQATLILLYPLAVDRLARVTKIIDGLVKDALRLLRVLLAKEGHNEDELKYFAEKLIFVLSIVELGWDVWGVLLFVWEVLLRLLAQDAEETLAVQVAIDEELLDLENELFEDL